MRLLTVMVQVRDNKDPAVTVQNVAKALEAHGEVMQSHELDEMDCIPQETIMILAERYKDLTYDEVELLVGCRFPTKTTDIINYVVSYICDYTENTQ